MLCGGVLCVLSRTYLRFASAKVLLFVILTKHYGDIFLKNFNYCSWYLPWALLIPYILYIGRVETGVGWRNWQNVRRPFADKMPKCTCQVVTRYWFRSIKGEFPILFRDLPVVFPRNGITFATEKVKDLTWEHRKDTHQVRITQVLAPTDGRTL